MEQVVVILTLTATVGTFLILLADRLLPAGYTAQLKKPELILNKGETATIRVSIEKKGGYRGVPAVSVKSPPDLTVSVEGEDRNGDIEIRVFASGSAGIFVVDIKVVGATTEDLQLKVAVMNPSSTRGCVVTPDIVELN